MFPIVSKRPLNEAGTVIEFVIKAPLVAKKCLPGQFIVLRLDEYGERIPLTIADYDRQAGTVTIMVQVSTSAQLGQKFLAQNGDHHGHKKLLVNLTRS